MAPGLTRPGHGRTMVVGRGPSLGGQGDSHGEIPLAGVVHGRRRQRGPRRRGTGRRAAVEKLLEGVGGRLESFDFAFGSDDVFVIADLPDNVTAAAVGLTVAAAGAASIRTVVLISPEEIDAAAKKTVEYRTPGA